MLYKYIFYQSKERFSRLNIGVLFNKSRKYEARGPIKLVTVKEVNPGELEQIQINQ